MKRLGLLAGVLTLATAGGFALAQLAPSVITPPQINNGDLVEIIPGGVPTATKQFVPYGGVANYIASQPGKGNALIGGDASTNLWQRNTTGSSVTTTVTYGGPDRWAYWSGTNTAMTVTRSNTAAALPTGYQQTFRMQRTAAQTGVVQMCMLQEVETVNSYQFQGTTAELDFHAYTGANFSAASSNMTAYIITGTGADEGVAGSASVAFGLNAGGGGSGGWTGQANATAAVINLGGVSTLGRYAAVANIPAGATEIAVALCYTPVGTAGTTDAVYFSDIQLVRNPTLAGKASATAGYSCDNTANPQIQCSAFERRHQAIETALQQRYYYQINEPAASKAVGNGNYQTSTICDVQIPLPMPMRAAPTLVIGGTAESNTTWAVMIASVTPVVLASTYLVQDAVIGNTPTMIAVQATTAAKTAGQGCTLVGAGGGANIQASAEL